MNEITICVLHTNVMSDVSKKKAEENKIFGTLFQCEIKRLRHLGLSLIMNAKPFVDIWEERKKSQDVEKNLDLLAVELQSRLGLRVTVCRYSYEKLVLVVRNGVIPQIIIQRALADILDKV